MSRKCSAERCPMQHNKANPDNCPRSEHCEFYTAPMEKERLPGYQIGYHDGVQAGYHDGVQAGIKIAMDAVEELLNK